VGTVQAIRIHETGGPEEMLLEELPTPMPGAGQALVRLDASGVNFIDIYHRSGAYSLSLPAVLGQEGAGVVEAVGPGVTEVAHGDRVAWAMVIGSYASHALVPSERLVRIPANVDTAQAAAVMLQGMTAHYLAFGVGSLGAEDTCLVHAAAGGVGHLLCQMLKMRGVRVIGTVSTEQKAQVARESGADDVILYTEKDFATETRRLTDGAGVSVVYDSVGRDTFERSLSVLRPRGALVLFGQSSGPVGAFDPQVLNAKGSLWLTRPSLAHYILTRAELTARADEVLGWIASGKLRLRIDSTFPLADAAQAHRALASRSTMGKVLLIP
jgi:NADPH2:quinone reductase